ncbi:TetR/AcrR family transcriptional regulator [Paenibacillus odorifer]|uniref:TetR family transcriptional regulator n=1 Tax=Paenibacillus odorifer TaxID=189426 RepID=A0AAD0KHW4_9BACL|nr:TetR family transcriptional regulator [Paenibacillus odorifer]AWV33534.1 TetR family transcriptional regulator [Paenibacillus odorifer]
MIKQTLRDFKKEATEKALAEAAFELALEHGLDGFVVEDIVQKAGYSRRTFANYFTCKEEAVARGAVTVRTTNEYEELLTKIPANASLLDTLYQLIKMQLTAELIGRLRELSLLSREFPALEPHFLRAIHLTQTEAQKTLLYLSNGKYDEVYTYLLINSVYGTVLPLIEGKLNVQLPVQTTSNNPSPETLTFDQFLETIYGYLRNGF